MSRIIEQKQMKDFLKLYTGLVERCFESCCNDFTSKALSTKEVGISFTPPSRPSSATLLTLKLRFLNPSALGRTRACRTASRSSSSTRSVWVRDSVRKSKYPAALGQRIRQTPMQS